MSLKMKAKTKLTQYSLCNNKYEASQNITKSTTYGQINVYHIFQSAGAGYRKYKG